MVWVSVLDMYGNEDGSVPATFQLLYFIGWKPDPSHLGSAKRGSGTISLKEIGEIVTTDKNILE